MEQKFLHSISWLIFKISILSLTLNISRKWSDKILLEKSSVSYLYSCLGHWHIIVITELNISYKVISKNNEKRQSKFVLALCNNLGYATHVVLSLSSIHIATEHYPSTIEKRRWIQISCFDRSNILMVTGW